ncbi:MAG TPA: TIGR02530 family flagellar biosynthesis protein [Syntrophomonadaceae bacterium]|jgi:flagellar operon protein|nr:flagellar protein [Syntrophomonadaceae bacterium]HOQ08697.1 TIGR02530 family flagellar biosynthesis protein [Syntrophomonadaceae bacterium]HPU48712.1 TIGR02530 family flagellar biosynthesis protein [Syntrophomonadaceae bacterium]
MDNRIYFPQTTIPPVTTGKVDSRKPPAAGTFREVLEQKLTGGLKFSQHAQERLKSRHIQLGDEEMQQLQEAVNRARAKGARESLVLMGDLALIVSVKNNTVITAVDGANIRENVFTNIDSAVII